MNEETTSYIISKEEVERAWKAYLAHLASYDRLRRAGWKPIGAHEHPLLESEEVE